MADADVPVRLTDARTEDDAIAILTVAGFSFLLHFAVFYFWPVRVREGSALFRSRVASMVHAIISCTCVFVWFSQFSPAWDSFERLMYGIVGTGDEFMPYATAVSVGYFTSDVLCMLTHADVYSHDAMAHHLVIGPAFGLALYNGVGLPCQFFFLLEELSTPFLNMKAFSSGLVNAISGYLFALTFIVSRLGFGSHVFFCVVAAFSWDQLAKFTPGERYSFVLQISMCCLSRLLNIYWALLIVRKLLGGGSSAKKTGGGKAASAAPKRE